MDAIGFIGAGSAIVVPHLLEDGLDCYVINDEERVGGHIHTKTLVLTEIIVDGQSHFKHDLKDWHSSDIEKFSAKPVDESVILNDEKPAIKRVHYIPIETGAEFIGAPENYPIVHAEFKKLGIALEEYSLDIDINNLKTGVHTYIPGFAQQVAKTYNDCCGFFSTKNQVTQESVLKHILELIAFKKVDVMVDSVDESVPRVKTVSELYIEVAETLLPGIEPSEELKLMLQGIVKDVLYPQLMASYGQPRAVVATFCANDANNYLAIGDNGWYRAKTGLSTYTHRLKEACKKTHFVPPQKAKSIEKEMVNEERFYKVKLEDGTYVVDPKTKQPKLFKYLMLSTNTEVMNALLSGIDEAELKELKEALAKVQYYNSTLTFHTDQKFVSPGGTKVYIPYDPIKDTASLNRSRADLFPKNAPLLVNSWMLDGQTFTPDPDKTFHNDTIHYRHPYVDNDFRHAQHVVEKFQGKYGLFFGGIVAGFNDSHESAMQANLRAAWRIVQVSGIKEHKMRDSAMPEFKDFDARQGGLSKVGDYCC